MSKERQPGLDVEKQCEAYGGVKRKMGARTMTGDSAAYSAHRRSLDAGSQGWRQGNNPSEYDLVSWDVSKALK